MMRWLRVARAEAVRDVKLSLRYPIQVVTGVVILYVLFMGIFTGAAMLAGGKAESFGSNLDALVIGYCMWFFAVMAINSMSVDIENEARQGTLEQIWLHTPNFLILLWVRGLVKVALGSGMVVLLSLLIQMTTGKWLAVQLAQLLPMVGVILLTVIGLAGFGRQLAQVAGHFAGFAHCPGVVGGGQVDQAVLGIEGQGFFDRPRGTLEMLLRRLVGLGCRL